MHQVGLLIVELETVRRKLQNVFELQNDVVTSEEKTRPILNGPESISSLPRHESRVGHCSTEPSFSFR
jgi:hypothetical protein